VFLCLRVKTDCGPCAVDFQCHGGLRLDVDGAKACLFPCSTDEECTSGFTCQPTEREGAPNTCQPTTGSCSCYEGADGGQRTCFTDNDIGSCQGVAECDPTSGWSACSAPEATLEECNGQDDDCDGVWDDDLEGVGGPCTNAVEGVGECVGVRYCLGQNGWLCQGPTPALETCNAQDDDCDGSADEDFKDGNGAYVGQQHCGGCGVSCDGKIPNALAFCSGAGPAPRCEVEECDPGYYEAGPLTCLPVVDNTCVPCLTDAHCDARRPLRAARRAGFCGTDCAAGNSGTGRASAEGFTCQGGDRRGGPAVRAREPVLHLPRRRRRRPASVLEAERGRDLLRGRDVRPGRRLVGMRRQDARERDVQLRRRQLQHGHRRRHRAR
jgi:hypothetical protein